MRCMKVSFINEKYADEYVAKLKRTSYRKVKPIRSYLCEKCLTWHLASTTDHDKKLLESYQGKIQNYRVAVKQNYETIKELKGKIQKLTQKT